ncbi:MAG: CoB--CoM heterodisulfide reductase iron-sulfur subunit B family protein [Armatimonadota bacterium]
MARSYGAFWGCFVAGRFPFIEKATRMVFETLDLPLADIQHVTCCPEKSLVANEDHEVWLLTAARNLAAAEEQDFTTIMSPCNGCYGTLKGVNEQLKTDPALRDRVNERLAEVGRRWTGALEVSHLVEVLHDHVSTQELKRHVQRPLEDIRVAVHAGCHYARPSNALRSDSPMDPRRYDAIVEALGATSVPYSTKLLCCGGTLNTAGRPVEAADMTREKLVELRRVVVDCLTTSCPACLMQYDVAQLVMEREGDAYNVPCISLPELVGVALGLDYTEMGADMHRIDAGPFFEKCLAAGQVTVP